MWDDVERKIHISDGAHLTECGRNLDDVEEHILPKDMIAEKPKIATCQVCIKAYRAWKRKFDLAFGEPLEGETTS